MQIQFVYRYQWAGEDRAYHVVSENDVVTVRTFVDGEIGAVVSPVPAGRMADIQAHIQANMVAGL